MIYQIKLLYVLMFFQVPLNFKDLTIDTFGCLPFDSSTNELKLAGQSILEQRQ